MDLSRPVFPMSFTRDNQSRPYGLARYVEELSLKSSGSWYPG